MKNYIYYLFLLLSFLIIDNTDAQCLLKKYSKGQNRLLGVPERLNTYVKDQQLQKFSRFGDDELSTFIGRDFNECKPWEVYSIRKNNKIFKSPTNNKLDEEVVELAVLGERFYIEELIEIG